VPKQLIGVFGLFSGATRGSITGVGHCTSAKRSSLRSLGVVPPNEIKPPIHRSGRLACSMRVIRYQCGPIGSVRRGGQPSPAVSVAVDIALRDLLMSTQRICRIRIHFHMGAQIAPDSSAHGDLRRRRVPISSRAIPYAAISQALELGPRNLLRVPHTFSQLSRYHHTLSSSSTSANHLELAAASGAEPQLERRAISRRHPTRNQQAV